MCISKRKDLRCDTCRHDFVVVETIDFYEGEDEELPPPMTQKDVMLLNRAKDYMDAEAAAATEENGGAQAMQVINRKTNYQ